MTTDTAKVEVTEAQHAADSDRPRTAVSYPDRVVAGLAFQIRERLKLEEGQLFGFLGRYDVVKFL